MFAEKPKRGATQRTVPRRDESSSIFPGWLKLMLGSLMTLTLMVMFYLWKPWAPVDREKQQVGLTDTANEQSTDEDYDFYHVLPKQQVTAIPQQPIQGDPTIVEIPAGSFASQNNSYMLQVNSFRDPDLADDLRSQVLMSGLPSSVRVTNMPSGEVWYRVVSGPFASQALAIQGQRTLQHHGIDSILVKMN